MSTGLPPHVQVYCRVTEVAEFETQGGRGAFRMKFKALPPDPEHPVEGTMEFATVIELPFVRGQRVLVTITPAD